MYRGGTGSITRRRLARALGVGIAIGGASLLISCREERRPSAAPRRIGYIAQAAGVVPDAFRDRLHELGYVEGTNLIIDVQAPSMCSDPNACYTAIAEQLVRAPVDVIVTVGPLATTAAARVTRTIPVVMSEAVFDPVAEGLVQSLARPGTNVTGVWVASGSQKLPELFRAALPASSRAAFLWLGPFPGAGTPPAGLAWLDGARAVGLDLVPADFRAASIADAFAMLPESGLDGLLVPNLPLPQAVYRPIVEQAARRGLPVVAWQSGWAAGALLSYGPSPAAMARRAADYVGRILSGDDPADLPVEQPSVFELIINLRTATSMGLTVPVSLLAQATEVVQ